MIANTKGQVRSTYNQVICIKLKEKYFSMSRRCVGYSSCGLREDYRILVKVRFKKVKAIAVMNSYEPQLPIQEDQASNSSYRDGNRSPGPALPEDPLALDKRSGRETFFEAEVGFPCSSG